MASRQHHRTRIVAALAALALLAGCGPSVRFSEWVLTKKLTSYRLGPLPDTWQRVDRFAGDVAFMNPDTSAVIMANASCADYEDAPLRSLTRHLLIGFTDREILQEAEVTLDGREALVTTVLAELDGVDVKMTLCVLKKNRCIYDMSYTSPVPVYDRGLDDFRVFMGGFQVLGAGK